MTRIIPTLLAAVLTASCAAPSTPVPAPRNVPLGEWRFSLGDPPGAEGPAFDDSAWRGVAIPHDWGVEGPMSPDLASGTGFLPGGIGWYRMAFEPTGLPRGGRLYAYFEGVYCNSTVWLNGVELGTRPYGYSSFRYDLTPALEDGRNVLAVRVDHSKFADSRWYTGSGITRPVSFEIEEAVHFDPWGWRVETVLPADGSPAEVIASGGIVGDVGGTETVGVAWELRDDGGRTVATAESRGGAPQVRMTVASPQPWSPASPTLYRLHATASVGGSTVDSEVLPVGIRSFRFDPDEGFFLNGENMKLKGVCLHHDAGDLGAAVPPEVWRHRLAKLKAMGCNAIRMSHNPPDPGLLDLCDEMGFLVQDEAFDEWVLGKNKWIRGWNEGEPGSDGYNEHFEEWAERDLKDMIRRDRIHPSIIMWSLGNEVDFPNDPYSYPEMRLGDYDPRRPNTRELVPIAKRLLAWAREEDSTRPLTMALANVPAANGTGLADLLDVAGYNYQEQYYEQDHGAYPDRVIYGSENGRSFEGWRQVRDNDFISGQFLWTGVDYLGESRGWPSRGASSGHLDLAGFEKPLYYFRQALWANEPMVYIASSDDPQTDPRRLGEAWDYDGLTETPDGSRRDVRVHAFSNCDEVELRCNGRSLGRRDRADFFEDGVATWSIPYERGVLRAVGFVEGREACSYELRSPGPPASLEASASRTSLRADGKDASVIEVRIVDADGNPVRRSRAEVACRITGPARLIGMENGDLRRPEPHGVDRREVRNGRLVVYVQAGTESGGAVVELASEGLEPARVTLSIE